jgi:hypothetical protein
MAVGLFKMLYSSLIKTVAASSRKDLTEIVLGVVRDRWARRSEYPARPAVAHYQKWPHFS